MAQVKVKLQDEVNAVVIGLRNDHINYFYEEFGAKAPGFFFNPRYKLGQWDGYIRFFQKTGKTYVNLLDSIVPKLSGLGYKINLEDNRTAPPPPDVPEVDKTYFSHIFHPEWNANIEMRPYQVRVLNSMINNGGGVTIAGTGAGKTVTCACLCDVYGQQGVRTITIVPSQDLIEQTAVEYEICGLDTGRYYSEVKDLDHQHVVSTWQSLQNNPTILDHFQMVVVDEVHGVKGKVLQELLLDNASHISLRFGLTGTLPKEATDAMAVRICIGSVVDTISAKELIDQGYLASLDIDILQLEEDFDEEYAKYLEEPLAYGEKKKKTLIQFKDAYFPDYTSEKRYLQHNAERREWIAAFLETKRSQKKGNVFCLVDGVAFGRKLAELIPGAIFLHGKDKQKVRKEAYDLFKDNDDVLVIATIQIASTGLNINRIFNLVFVDVGKSFIRVIQTIGRGLRKAADKDSVSVTDITSDLKYSKKHSAERTKFYKEAGYPHKKKKIRYNDVNI